MRIMIDTNIVLDTLARREPFFEQSQAVLQLVATGSIEGAITASTITDIYYILRKHLGSEALRSALYGLIELLEVVEVTRADCLTALNLPMDDYEDALLVCCAGNWRADCIITRNAKDFTHSPIRAITPQEFLATLPAT